MNKDFADAVQLFEPEQGAVYSIEDAGHITHTSRRNILTYYKHGLVSPVTNPEEDGFYFDGDGIRTLRQIEFLRADYGVNLAGIKVILRLINEVERLHGQRVFEVH